MGKAKEEGLFRFIYTKLNGISNKDLTKISTIGAIAFIILGWVIKAGWYAYMLGKFKVYNIDSCYFNSDNDNIILETLKLAVLAAILFFINYYYYDLLHEKSTKKIICFWIVEMFFVFLLIFFTSASSIKILFQVNFKIAICLILFDWIICRLITVYATVYYRERNRKRVNKEKVHNTQSISNKSKTKNKYYLLLYFIIVIAVELVLIYFLGFILEKNRISYKVVVDADLVELKDINLENNNIYPIVYENNDIYILSQLNNDGKINYKFQKIIDKKEIETIYIQDINTIK